VSQVVTGRSRIVSTSRSASTSQPYNPRHLAYNPGTRLGPYEIVAPLGAGGMGEVYRARDPKLNREVAVKVLPLSFAGDPERLARLNREAQVLAALNHPHIGAIYGLDEADSHQFLVLELVDGESLDKRIARGPIPIDEALAIARQIAEALEAAHEKGIIHRDLKPANIAVKEDGNIKILDFGLAKAAAPAEGLAVDLANSPTITSPALMTGVGMILGTAAYMSPEQAKGKPVDKRADIWAFGCVLYEVLTRERAFPGEDITDCVVAVMTKEPDWIRLPPQTPPAVRQLLRRCLEKDVKRRLRDIGDARLDLDEASSAYIGSNITGTGPATGSLRTVAIVVGAVVSSAILAGLATRAAMRPAGPLPETRHLTRFSIALPPGVAFPRPQKHLVALSPDGSRLVFVANRQLYVRMIDQNDPLPLRGTELDPAEPVFSPDGEWVAFWANNQLKKIAVSGGAPVTLCDAALPSGVAWNGDSIFFAAGPNGIYRTPAAGGSPVQVVSLDAKAHEQANAPQLLADGDSLLYTLRTGLNLDDATVVVQSLKTGQRRVVVRGAREAHYVVPDYIVYARGGELFAVPFAERRLEVIGNPVSLVEGVMSISSSGTTAAQFAVSASGTLAYVPRPNDERILLWLDQQGHEEPISAPARAYFYPRLSPDQNRIAVDVHDRGNDIWIWDVVHGLSRFTFGEAQTSTPVWSADGHRILYSAIAEGSPGLFWKSADGTGPPEALGTHTPEYGQVPEAVSSDGKFVTILDTGLHANDISLLSLQGDHTTRALLHSEFSEAQSAISADARWLAYTSTESGRSEVYVRPFPTVSDGEWQVSTAGGRWPLWSPDGRSLFYTSADVKLMVVDVQTKDTFRHGEPRALFDMRPYTNLNPGRPYDITRDGRRFLAMKNVAAQDMGQVHVVERWIDEVRTRVPTK